MVDVVAAEVVEVVAEADQAVVVADSVVVSVVPDHRGEGDTLVAECPVHQHPRALPCHQHLR